MHRYSGKSVLKGIAVGRIYCYKKQEYQVVKEKADDAGAEKERFEAAVEKAKEQLSGLYDEAIVKAGEEHAMIFEIQRMMLEDLDYLEAAQTFIAEGWKAEYAVDAAGAQMAGIFSSMEGNDYMQARAVDIKDVSARVVRILAGISEDGIAADEPVILVAEDLAPSETVKMDKEKILAFVTVKGSANSHTAILARSMNLPSLVNTKMEDWQTLAGKMGVVDGFAGEFLAEPPEEVLQDAIARRDAWQKDLQELELLKGKDNVTGDGRRIDVFANIGNADDAGQAQAADAGGIGLFRSEFLYLGRDGLPTEEEQFNSYKAVFETMGDKKVVIRTLDIGADKQADYLGLEKEENPALGYRAIRICLERTDIFTTQLRAIYRASAYGKAAIMFPMIISAEEIRRIKEITEQVKSGLLSEGHKIGEPELGIMVETPAAAVMSDELAREVDFFSIGTNDLTQYTLAADRQNQKLENIADPHHPAVLRLIEMTVKNGHAAGIWVGICGELAADTELTRTFLDMGVDELSVSPGAVLKVRRAVREI